MTEFEIIKGCIKHDPACQRTLYEQFFSKMMGICLRFSKGTQEAKIILHEGFLRIFENVKSYRGEMPLEEWIRKIIVSACVDYLRRNRQSYLIVNTVNAAEIPAVKEKPISDDEILNKISKDNVLKAVQDLSPAYRTVYNLFSFEKYSHKQISERLDISEETSRSNLAKAKFNIRKNLIRVCNDK